MFCKNQHVPLSEREKRQMLQSYPEKSAFNVDEFIGTDDALFHYTKSSIAEKILHTQKIKLSFLKDSNDPKEYRFIDTIPMDWGSLQPAEENMKLINQAMQNIDKIVRSEHRILCFCSNKKPTLILKDRTECMDDYAYLKGWFKPRMWVQYGELNYGICLVFSKKDLAIDLEKIKGKVNNYKSDYVKYTQEEGIPQEAIIIECDRIVSNGPEEYSINHVKENTEELFYQKHIDYRDEAEYRVVVHDPNVNLDFIDICPSIKAVIIGERTPRASDSSISQLCKKLQIKLKRIYWNSGIPMLLNS